MSQNRSIIFKLQNLIDLKEETIVNNKRTMKDYLLEYKRSLEIDKELKKEQKLLREAINLLQYGFALEDDILELENSVWDQKSQNNAPNRDNVIINSDEE